MAVGADRPFPARDDAFMFIAAISFAVTAIVLWATSLRTRPHPPEALRGLVYRGVAEDDEVQQSLRQRLDDGGGEP